MRRISLRSLSGLRRGALDGVCSARCLFYYWWKALSICFSRYPMFAWLAVSSYTLTPAYCFGSFCILLYASGLGFLCILIRELLTNIASCLLFASYMTLDFSLGQSLELFLSWFQQCIRQRVFRNKCCYTGEVLRIFPLGDVLRYRGYKFREFLIRNRLSLNVKTPGRW